MASFQKDIFSVGVSKFLIITFGILTSVITARTLGAEKNGVIAALLVYPSLFMTIGSLGIRQSTTYFIGKKIYPEKDIKTAITQIWILSTAFCLISSYFLITEFSKSGEDKVLVLLALIPIPFTLFNTYNSGVFLGKNQIQAFNKINWYPPLLILILTFLLVYLLNGGIKGYMIALIIGPLFIFVFLLFKNKFTEAFSIKLNLKIIKSMLSLGLAYALALLIINLNTQLDIILLDKLSSQHEVGIYSKGAVLAQYVWQIPMLLGTIIFARSALERKNDNKISVKVTQILRLSIVFVGFGLICLFVFSPTIIIGLYGNEFRGSISVLRILTLGVFVMTLFKSMNQDMAGKGKPWVSMKAMIPALIVNIILNLLFIPEHGANGASLASTISYTIAGILFLHFYSKEVKISIKEILKYKKTDFDPILLIIKSKMKNNENSK
jgi:O-antigen/teichoic acid export membrane protein